MLFIELITGQKQCHPKQDENDIDLTKKRVGYTGETKDSKKYGYICTCCHADDLLGINM